MYDGQDQWPKEMERIRNSPIRFSRHSRKRIRARGITLKDIVEVVKSGEIIQGNAPGTYGDNQDPVRVIIGHVAGDRVIHLVAAIRKNVVIMVTAYRPSKKIWEDDCRTLKPPKMKER